METKYLTVTALTNYIKRKIDSDPHLGEVYIKGEISNFNRHRRGHMYFTLKDNQARISAVMFFGYNKYLKFLPENGMSVLVKGQVSVYENFGQYQLYVHSMSPDGVGALYLAYEQLKESLSKEGLFDEKHKLALPSYPERIGVITSDTGAALQDILTTFKERYPLAKITVFPALVQGELAVDSLVEAIRKAENFSPKMDLLIIGRGGGSIEDLQPFNEERLARAIFESPLPIISAVGHETDFTISDFVADLRAPTPTGAVMLSVPSREELLNKITHYQERILSQVNNLIQSQVKQLDRYKNSYAFRYPEQLMKQKEQELDLQIDRLEKSSLQHIKEERERLRHIKIRLEASRPEANLQIALKSQKRTQEDLMDSMTSYLAQRQEELNKIIDKLNLLNPLYTIKRGFALPYKEDGSLIKSSKQVKEKDQIIVEIHDAYIDCLVKDVRDK